MGNLSSGNFKPTNAIQLEHNDRTLEPSYLLPKELQGRNEVNRNSQEARELKEQIIKNAIETYENRTKRTFKAKKYNYSLVVNLKETSTMQDLRQLAEHFQKKYGFQCYQIAIHRDEGHIDENNKPHINHHAHMEFITLDATTGKNRWREINQIKLREIQTEIAQILGMERGTDKRISGVKRIEPRKFAQMKEKEKKALSDLKNQQDKELRAKENQIADTKRNLLVKTIEMDSLKKQLEKTEEKHERYKRSVRKTYLKQKEIKARLELERKNMLDENKKLKENNQSLIYTAESYAKLRKLVDLSEKITNDELEQRIKDFRELEKKAVEHLKNSFDIVGIEKPQQWVFNHFDILQDKTKELKDNLTKTQNQANTLTDTNKELNTELDALKSNKTALQTELSTLKTKNTNLQEQINKLNTENNNQKTDLQKQIKSLQTELETKDSTITNLTNDKNKLEKAIKEQGKILKTFHDFLESIFKMLKLPLEKFSENFTYPLFNELETILYKIQEIAKENTDLKTENETQQEIINSQIEQINKLKPKEQSYGRSK